MRRALIAYALLASATAAADEPAAEDPKQAIRERGIALDAGKKLHVIIVPAASLHSRYPAGTKLANAVVYFGDNKTLFKQDALTWVPDGGDEHVDLLDQLRKVVNGTLHRIGGGFELRCDSPLDDRPVRKIPLVASTSSASELASKAVIRDKYDSFAAYLLAREVGGTTYYLVDRPHTKKGDSTEFRLFIGKRGAMKRIPIKEIASDSVDVVLVTTKGRFLIQKSGVPEPGKPAQDPTASFGPTAAKQTALKVLPTYPNRGLIYQDLGVYARERTGHPCDEL